MTDLTRCGRCYGIPGGMCRSCLTYARAEARRKEATVPRALAVQLYEALEEATSERLADDCSCPNCAPVHAALDAARKAGLK